MRKTLRVTITDEGRDKGKTFLLTEMSSIDAFDWGAEAMWMLMQNGAQLPENVTAEMGLAGIAAMGPAALKQIPWSDARRLLERLMSCVQMATTSGIDRALTPDDIEEIPTQLKLRAEAFKLHVGFIKAANPSSLETGERPGAVAEKLLNM